MKPNNTRLMARRGGSWREAPAFLPRRSEASSPATLAFHGGYRPGLLGAGCLGISLNALTVALHPIADIRRGAAIRR